MLGHDELILQDASSTGWPQATLSLVPAGGSQPVGLVYQESWPPDPLDRPGWLRWLLGFRQSTVVRRWAVRTANDGQPCFLLQFVPPVFQEVVRVYDAEGKLLGRCISFWKQTLSAGFHVRNSAGQLFAEVPFTLPGTADHSLLARPAGDRLGLIRREEEPVSRSRPCYRVTVEPGEEREPWAHLFLLAAALVLLLAQGRDSYRLH